MKISKVFTLASLAALACAGLGSYYLLNSPLPAQKSSVESVSVGGKQSPFRSSIASKSLASAERKIAKTKPKTQLPLAFKLAATLPQPYQEPLPAGIDPKTLPRPARVLSSTKIERSSLSNLTQLTQGQKIGLPLPDGSSYDAQVNLLKPSSNGIFRVGGSLIPAGSGSFSLAQKGSEMTGTIRVPSENRGYVIKSLQNGEVIMQEHDLTELMCVGMKPMDGEVSTPEAAAATSFQAAVPLIDTRPAAAAVIYLDFDGETVVDPDWNGGVPINAQAAIINGQGLSAAHITSVVNAVAEDYAPFNVSVTTSLARYTAATPGQRMRCIVTPTDAISGGSAAGVAYLDSWSEAGTTYSDDVPCWCFGMYDPASMALVISHEIGHTFGLSHDGTSTQAYYGGHQQGDISWGPIMGAPYGRTMTQFARNQYFSANNPEDDLAIIGNLINDIGEVTDEDPAVPALVDTVNGFLDFSAVLTSSADQDSFEINSFSGPITINCLPVAIEENVDVELILRRTDFTIVSTSAPSANRSASISANLPEGKYFIVVRPSGDGPDATTGYNSYGSVGAYRITGSYTPVPQEPVITQQPLSIAAVDASTIELKVVALGSSGLGYQWLKDGFNVQGNATATTPTLRLTNMTAEKAGVYTVLVRNAANPLLDVLSDPATVTVDVRPKITTQPKSLTVESSTSPAFTVAATGTGPLVYTWEKMVKPTPIVVGGNSPTLTFNNVQLADAGSYRVTVTNVTTGKVASVPTKPVLSSVVTLKVNSPPVILTPTAPTTVVLAERATGTLKVSVGGLAPFAYEWFKVNGPVETLVGKAATLSVGNLNGPGIYRVKVWNTRSDIANPTVSPDFTVEVDAKPTIATKPNGGSFEAGVPVTLSVVAGGSPINRTYQWFKDNKVVVGANTDTLSFNPVQWANRGSYTVAITNRVGTVKSVAAILKIASKPVILTQPASMIGARTGTAAFTVVAGGDAPLSYEWFKVGDTKVLGKAAKLTITALNALEDNGSYFCRVSNKHLGGAFTDTNVVTLDVQEAPAVTGITSNMPKHKVAVNGSITLSATITGTPPLSYQWLKAGKAILGANSATLTLDPAQLSQTGSYSLAVTNLTPVKKTSAALAVAVLVAPSITLPPVSVTVIEATPAKFEVKAAGSPVLKYQWHRISSNGMGGTNRVLLPGKTASTLTFNAPVAADSDSYQCFVSNDVGSVWTPEVTLSVTPTPPSTVTDFRPKIAQTGEKIRVFGANLNFATSVKIGTATAAFTKVSSSELLVTVPAGAPGSPGAPIQVISLATTSPASSFNSFVRSSIPANDNLEDAVILSGTNFTYVGDSSAFTANDVVYDLPGYVKSAWMTWTAPSAGTYQISVTTSIFDTVLIRYDGAPGSITSRPTSIDFYGSGEVLSVTAAEGQNYVFGVAGYPFIFPRTGGPYRLRLLKTSVNAPLMNNVASAEASSSVETVAVNQAWQEEGGDGEASKVISEKEGSQSVLLGGTNGINEPVNLWSADAAVPSDSGNASASLNLKLNLPEGSESSDRFGWTIYDQDKSPLASLWINAADGVVHLAQADGTDQVLDQKVISGSRHKFEFSLDRDASTLNVSIDGVTLVEALSLPANSRFGDIGATWIPSQDGSPHASMVFDDVNVTFEK